MKNSTSMYFCIAYFTGNWNQAKQNNIKFYQIKIQNIQNNGSKTQHTNTAESSSTLRRDSVLAFLKPVPLTILYFNSIILMYRICNPFSRIKEHLHKSTYWHAFCHTSNLEVHCRSHCLGTIIFVIWDFEFPKGIIFRPEGILACLKTRMWHC